jgi:GTPase SAR1 family protein
VLHLFLASVYNTEVVTAELWKTAGFDESQSLLINVMTGTTNIISTFIAIALIDKVGRSLCY